MTTMLPASPTADDVHALARSSPWRWSTLRFVRRVRWPQPHGPRVRDVRAFLRRPDLLRVEDLRTGELLGVIQEAPHGGSWLTTGRGAPRRSVPPDAREPQWRPDGLVAVRPSGVDTDAPMFRDYQWVGMLDPVELADDIPGWPGTELTHVAASRHRGRAVWEAVAVATDHYQPRCDCCPLLQNVARGAVEPLLPDVEPAHEHFIRLDVETGVCVHVHQLGGTHDGWRLDVEIEAVDEPMPDDLFPVTSDASGALGPFRRLGREISADRPGAR